jgi:hypothetical protein
MIKAGICLGLTFAVAAFAADNRTSQSNPANNATSTEHHRTSMQNPKAKQSEELGAMLESTTRARTAISQSNRQQAIKDVQQALDNAKLVNSRHSGSDLVPLYTELERVSVIEPILKRHQSQSNSGTNGSTQSGSASQDSSSSRANRALGVHEVIGGYSSAFLDLNAAQKNLNAAQQALNSNNLKQADRDLQAVEDSVVVESVAADMPLLRARENLVFARDNAQMGHYQRAQAELQAASRALADYEKTTSSHNQDAEHLRSDIGSYAQSLTKNHSDAASKIESWWDQTTNWITPANANNTATASNRTGSQPNAQR